MRNKTAILLVLIIAVLSILAFGCKGEEKKPEPVKPKPTEFVIGCITPLTGSGATYGKATQQGADLAMSEINQSGGINGTSIRIIYEDDKIEPKEGVNAINKLISINKVPVILGAFGSSVTLAIAPIAEENKVVLFSASSTADAIKDAGDYIFRNVPPNSAQGKTAADFALRFIKAKASCILRMNNDYGVSLGEAFKTSFENRGGKILLIEEYNPDSTDFRAQLTKIRDKKADVIFYPGHYKESALILKQAKELGVKSVFIGGDGSYSPELISIAGNAAEGSYYTMMAIGYGQNVDEKVKAFTEAYKIKYGVEPDAYASYAYDAAKMISEAIRIGGYSADGIKSSLYNMNDFYGVTGLTKFDQYGEVDKPYGIYEVKSGNFTLISW